MKITFNLVVSLIRNFLLKNKSVPEIVKTVPIVNTFILDCFHVYKMIKSVLVFKSSFPLFHKNIYRNFNIIFNC